MSKDMLKKLTHSKTETEQNNVEGDTDEDRSTKM
jgi:hypothetical protein